MDTSTIQHEFKQVLTPDQIAHYKTKFRSASGYMPLWETLKRDGIVVASTENRKAYTINEALVRLKKQDYYFKVACEEELQGRQLTLDFYEDTSQQTLTIRLIDTGDKFNLLNLQ